jgi:hypothetical protein
MSDDILKQKVYDPRIVQNRPKFAAVCGAASLATTSFSAIGATTSAHSYNIIVPSENVYVDRLLQWFSQVLMTSNAVLSVQPVQGTPIAQYGRDWSLCAFPLNSLCTTITAAINNTTVSINTVDVLKEVLRLTDFKKMSIPFRCSRRPTKTTSFTPSSAG